MQAGLGHSGAEIADIIGKCTYLVR